MTPSGPHMYGHFVSALAASWAGAAFAVDFDPRWVKELYRSTGDATGYVHHLIGQTVAVLTDERPALLFTTSKLLLELAVDLPAPLTRYGVRAVCTGGTSCTAEEARYLREEFLEGVAWIDTYGNTLAGHALQADPIEPGGAPSYHLPPPLAVLRVVDPDDPTREVSPRPAWPGAGDHLAGRPVHPESAGAGQRRPGGPAPVVPLGRRRRRAALYRR